MAGFDYKHCDLCGRRAFYDAELAYTEPEEDDTPFLEAGKSVGVSCLGNLGDWAVICTDCAKTHKTVIVPKGENENGTTDNELV